jgi:GNAT superfamily N-acetyltransferase
MKDSVLYIHGKGGSAAESEHYAPLFPGCEVIGLDCKSFTPWEAGKEIRDAVENLHCEGRSVTLVANSIGAYFSMSAGIDALISRAYFISPIVDLERLIRNMMVWANVTEDELQSRGVIPTAFGEDLSWDYLCYVREHPVSWNAPTEILYGSADKLTDYETVAAFAKAHRAGLTVMDGGDHWFHTPEQLAFLDRWIKQQQETGMEQEIVLHEKHYRILRLLGHGKGGYSYLAEREGRPVVLKQIHHEPCDYYQFGNKIEAERRDYARLKNAGIRIPELLDIDTDAERIVKAYVDGQTIAELIHDGVPVTEYLPQVREMAAKAQAHGLNIDYYPTNFVVSGGELWYIDYECNDYMPEWDFEHWGVKHWLPTVECRAYREEDFDAVCAFLIALNQSDRTHINWNWARFEWMIEHPEFDKSAISSIGLWWERGRIVGAAIYDMYFGEAFCAALPGCEALYPKILDYACRELKDEAGLGIALCDGNQREIEAAETVGFAPAEQSETLLRLELDKLRRTVLPEGYTLSELDPAEQPEDFQWLLWQGFDHGTDYEEFKRNDPIVPQRRPNLNKRLSLAAAAPDGALAAYCCVWVRPDTDYAYVEPVCTVPAHRGKGIAAALLSEALARAKALGAREAYVISDLPFYEKLGFEKMRHYTFYRKP